VEPRAIAKALLMTANANLLPPSMLERVLARDRRLIAAALAALIVLSWSYLIFLSRQMGGDAGMAATTPMPAMPNMPSTAEASAAASGTGVRTFALAALMWWTMMIGMMLPSAAAMILLFGNVQRRQLATEHPRLRVALFTAGYLAIWAAFSALVAAAQLAFAGRELLTAMDLRVTTWLGAVLVALAGIYQLTPFKNACLRRCRSPAEFLASHWRRGSGGAVRMGFQHGLYCVGCCWALMALLFVVGVMNLLWVAAIALFVLLEKLLPYGETTTRISGAALLLFAGYLAILG
jgi:predicted metal-binding membrane protein